jgi:hypothetical protein
MTKELNLFVGDTTSDTKTTKAEPTAETNSKEGKSLFDNLLSNIDEEVSTQEESVQTKKENISQKVKSENKNVTVNTSSNNKTNEVKIDNASKIVNTPKAENQTMSLLDRMMLEANEEIKSDVSKTTEVKVANNIVKTSNPVINTKNQEIITEKNVPEIAVSKDEKPLDNKTIERKVKPENLNQIKKLGQSKEVEQDSIQKVQSKSFFDSLLEDVEVSADENQNSTKDSKAKVDVNSKVASQLTTNIDLDENINKVVETPINKDEVKKDLKTTQVAKEQKTVTSPIQTEIKDNNIIKEVKTINTPLESEIVQDKSKQQDNIKTSVKTDIEKVVEVKQPIDKTIQKVDVVKDIEVKQTIPEKKNAEIVQKSETTKTVKEVIVKLDNNINEEIIVAQKDIDTKKVNKDEIVTNKVFDKTVVKNENVASQLAKISDTQVDAKVNVSKEDIEKLDPKIEKEVEKPLKNNIEKIDNTLNTKNKSSLLDKLIEESKNIIKNDSKEIAKVEVGKINEPIKQSVNPLVSNIYLSSQKENINKAAIAKVSIGKDMVNNATGIKDIEKSAEFLDLG